MMCEQRTPSPTQEQNSAIPSELSFLNGVDPDDLNLDLEIAPLFPEIVYDAVDWLKRHLPVRCAKS